ncbi:metal-dependent hydrolase [Nevskia ramosa]|uniref:metal-dependent hydrolase n=1 Tax=Nevskia ramosa TaxID=64002 RepID=UPI0003B665AC|nr:metal-dependent hydrolase [Nevskia ramosa]
MPAKTPILPTRRDLKFNPPAERIHDWLDGGVHFTLLMNTMSLVIPVGERFFIDAVRHYRDQITDPELKKAATAFIGQEATHGREHDEYNALMFQRLPAAKEFEDSVKALLARIKKRSPPSARLSVTIALEHITAIMADGLLSEPYMIEQSERHFAALWKWHALEETEHKGVPFDVYEMMMGRGPRAYVERSMTLVVATAIFWGKVIPAFIGFVRDEGKLGDLKGWREFWRVGFGEVGFLRKMVRPWFNYLRPGFHPWDHDNSHYLQGIEDFSASWQAKALTAG